MTRILTVAAALTLTLGCATVDLTSDLVGTYTGDVTITGTTNVAIADTYEVDVVAEDLVTISISGDDFDTFETVVAESGGDIIAVGATILNHDGTELNFTHNGADIIVFSGVR